MAELEEKQQIVCKQEGNKGIENSMEESEDKQKTVDKVDDNNNHNNNTKVTKDSKNISPPKQLLKMQNYIHFYYCTNKEFLTQRLPQIFPLSDLYEFLQSMQSRGPIVIRVNNNKSNPHLVNRDLTNRKIRLEIVEWTRYAFVVHSKNLRRGATPEFLHGHYLSQDLSGLLPVLALSPQNNEKILDLCAGVGRKASHICDLMRNTGALFANDINDFRIRSLRINFHRLGVRNSIITNLDGRKYSLYISDFDRVLVDVPSSGSGIISKEPLYRIKLDENEIERLADRQKELLLAAIDCVKTGGVIVYSTNSILPEENECVVEYALTQRKVKLVETKLPIGAEGLTEYMGRYFTSQMTLTRRFYPHADCMDGSFVAKLMKIA